MLKSVPVVIVPSATSELTKITYYEFRNVFRQTCYSPVNVVPGDLHHLERFVWEILDWLVIITVIKVYIGLFNI